MKKDIENRQDIKRLVDTFYDKVNKDPLISHFFTEAIKVNWEKHIPVMIDFWDNALFYTGGYNGNPLEVHKRLHTLSETNKAHFERWNELFTATVNELFKGEKASLAINKANSISTIMQLQILKKEDHLKGS